MRKEELIMTGNDRIKPNPAGFVKMVIHKLKQENLDTAFRAALRQADNPFTKSKSWEYISYYCNIDNNKEWKAFTLIGAAIARLKDKLETDGDLGIGQALLLYYSRKGRDNRDDNGIDKAAKARFQRLLACQSTEEACEILRPMLNLINSGGTIPVNYTALLRELLYDDDTFNDKIKTRWAKNFYRKMEEDV
jgi:CRISPR system Cascade subunit CasB